ncbi:MAG: hypothetical protein ACOY90_15780 [Candidatus Zhuqueibacterota bacterium]
MESTTGENEKRLLAATVRERLIGNRNIILYKELLENKIPKFLKNYLQNSVQKFVHTEEPVQFNNSKRFDLEDEKINHLKILIIKAFEEATIFSRDELIEIINRTVRLQFDLLVQPGATLIKIFYRNKSDRVQNEVLQILDGLEDRRIFVKTLIKNIREFDQYHIVEVDFKNLLHKTEKEVYETNFISAFLSDVLAFAEFLSYIHGRKENQMSTELVKLLLTERNNNSYSERIKAFKEDSVEISKIPQLFGDINDRALKVEGDNNHNEDDLEKFIMNPDETIQPIELEDKSKVYESEIRLSFGENDKTFDRDDSDVKIADRSSDSRPAKAKHPIITNVGKDPLDMIITRSKIEEQPSGPLTSLEYLIDEKSKKFIIKRIFKNDDFAYTQFIRKLEIIHSWKKAKIVIDKELLNRSIQPFSKEALRLGDLVFNRYFPKKH